jgi:hypothetical protein
MLEVIKENKCPRCLQGKPDVLLDQEGEPYMCDDCWNEDSPTIKCACERQNEVAQETAEYIAHIYFTKSDKIFNEFMEYIADGKFTGSYSRCADCEIRVGE